MYMLCSISGQQQRLRLGPQSSAFGAEDETAQGGADGGAAWFRRESNDVRAEALAYEPHQTGFSGALTAFESDEESTPAASHLNGIGLAEGSPP